MFTLRGPRQPPDGVVIISLDNESSVRLGLSENFSKWPRSVHAGLVERLNSLGASVIAFDVHFPQSGDDAGDRDLAGAISRAGNVILYEKLKRETLDGGGGSAPSSRVEVDVLVPPAPPLAAAALAIAPFPLPKIPIRVSQAWLFKGSAGDAPTLPVVALQAMAIREYNRLYTLLLQSDPNSLENLVPTWRQSTGPGGLVKTMQAVREQFQQDTLSGKHLLMSEAGAAGPAGPAGPDRLSATEKARLKALVNMYAGESSVYINFYGPPETFPTISYHEILSPPPGSSASLAEQIKGKAVFVGAARLPWSDQKDGFYTVYSQPDGLDLNGVEIGATVFANLLEGSSIKILSPSGSLVILLGCAAVLALLATLLAPLTAIVVIVLISSWLPGLSPKCSLLPMDSGFRLSHLPSPCRPASC